MPEPVHRGSVEIAGQQPDLEVIQHIERAFASLHRTLAALGRILLDALQRQQRIEDNTYGYCEETGEPISLKRLEARPIATLSVEAQERHEKREKVYRDE